MAGLYIHVPFCAKRCLYCDFFSNTDMSFKQEYLVMLMREIELRKDYLGGEPLDTIYFGGGTPSQLQPDDFRSLFEVIDTCFDTRSCQEITLEVNPDDMTSAYAKAIATLPFNRISMGVQSFDLDDLRFLNRRHDRIQSFRAVEWCQGVGMTNISIDLIYGLPGQTLNKWRVNLEEALKMDVPHISAYHLIYEEGTELYKLWKKKKVQSVDEEVSLQLFSVLIDTLTAAGYEQYEISNFARPGFVSRHNSSYWKGIPYLGLGPSAHSYNGSSREWNVSSLPAYLQGIRNDAPVIEREELDLSARYNDYIITRLRTSWGVDSQKIKDLFGDPYFSYFNARIPSLVKEGLVIEKEGCFSLSREGIFISDTVMRELIFV